MRLTRVVLGLWVAPFSGCVASAPPPGLEPAAYSLASTVRPNEQVQAIYTWCIASAAHNCPGATLRCEAYRPAYVRSCMVKGNVPPEYIAALAR